jgi:hypothetical protein
VSASADTQERWRQYYEKSASQNQNDRDAAGDLIQRAESRAFWQTCFMIGSTVFVGGLMTVFYNVLSR